MWKIILCHIMSQCHSSIRPKDQESQSFPWRNTISEIVTPNPSPVSEQAVPKKVPVVQFLRLQLCSGISGQQVWAEFRWQLQGKPSGTEMLTSPKEWTHCWAYNPAGLRAVDKRFVLIGNRCKWKDVLTWSLWLLTCTSIAVVQTINLVAMQQ